MNRLPKVFLDEFKNVPAEVDRLIYLREKDTRKKIGVVILDKDFCGWSLCKDFDQWDTFSGILIAYERMLEGKTGDEWLRGIHRLNWKVRGSFVHSLKTATLYYLLQELLITNGQITNKFFIHTGKPKW